MRLLIAIMLTGILTAPVFATISYISEGYFGTAVIQSGDTLIMTGGGGDTLMGENNSIIHIRNTSSPFIDGESGIKHISMGGKLYFSGGCAVVIDIGGDGTAILNGGQIDGIRSGYFFPADPERVKFICNPGYQLTYTGNVVTKISGTWLDGNAFSIKLYTYSGYSDMFSNMTIIPEPATMLLLGLGGIFLRRRQ